MNLIAQQYSPSSTYLDIFDNQAELGMSDRHILANWLLIIQVEFKLMPETYQTTMSIIDRFLEKRPIELM